MLSSRAAAFSVKALLTGAGTESRSGGDSTPPEADQTQDQSVEVVCMVEREEQGKHGHTETMVTKDTAGDEGSPHHPARLSKGDTNIEDDDLVVDVETCTPSAPSSPHSCSSPTTLLSPSQHPGPPCPSSPSPATILPHHQHPADEPFPSSAPSSAVEWQMLTQVGGVGGCGWAGSRQNSGEGRDTMSVELLQQDLWAKFHALTTEMIITKNGRRMFPVVKVRVRGLDPEKSYMVFLDMVAADTRRYRYVYPSSRWMVAGTGEPVGDQPRYIHPDSPATGVQWMAAPAIAFDRLKLTNNKTREVKGQIVLHSMQKFVPRVWVQEVSAEASWADLPALVDLTRAHHASFPETAFITVTAYQNQQITRLKIDSNPFAKGFRETNKQKEVVERHGGSVGGNGGNTTPPSPMMHPFPHLSFPVAGSLHHFPSQYTLQGGPSPPVSPLLLHPHWLAEALKGGDRTLPWMPDLSAASLLPSPPPTLPFLLPSFLPGLHAQLPCALDLSKPKGDT